MNVKNAMEQEQSPAQRVRDRKPNLVKSAMGRGKSYVTVARVMGKLPVDGVVAVGYKRKAKHVQYAIGVK